jgi:hypothetical protein
MSHPAAVNVEVASACVERTLPLPLTLISTAPSSDEGAPFFAFFAKEPALSLPKGGNHRRLKCRLGC